MTTFLEYQNMSDETLKQLKFPFFISINTIGDYIRMHHHDLAELSFVIEGSGTETINTVTHAMQSGTASFLLPHHIHSLKSDPGNPIRLYCCMFDFNLLYGSPYELELIGQLMRTGTDLPGYVDFTPEQSQQLRHIFADMLQEFNGQNFGKFSLIRSKLIEALLLFSRVQGSGRGQHSGSTRQETDSKSKLWDILLYMHLHYPEKITLEDLSSRFKVTPSYISHSFKKFCGKSFLEYLHSLRIHYAASMLLSTDMAITDIAVEAGFDSFRSFCRVFKQYHGVSASAYREMQNGKQVG